MGSPVRRCCTSARLDDFHVTSLLVAIVAQLAVQSWILIGLPDNGTADCAQPRIRALVPRPFPPFWGGVWGRDYWNVSYLGAKRMRQGEVVKYGYEGFVLRVQRS